MKAYVYQYKILLPTGKEEIRTETFTDVKAFIEAVGNKQEKYYISEEKCFGGELEEINKHFVLNPF